MTDGSEVHRPLHALRWERADALGAPFSSDALAELLGQWGAGLAGDRAGRRMALRLSERRLRLVPDPPPGTSGVPEPCWPPPCPALPRL